MPKYVIERTVPGAGDMSAEELRDISSQSVKVLSDLGPGIQWQHTYVTDDKLYCVYVARDEDLIREHGRGGGFPVDAVHRVASVIEPVTAEA